MYSRGFAPGQAFLKVIGGEESRIFAEREVKEAAFLKKKRRWDKRDGKEAGPTDEELEVMEREKERKYQDVLQKKGSAGGSGPAGEKVREW